MKLETRFDIGQKVWVIWKFTFNPKGWYITEDTIDWLKVYRVNPKAQKFSIAYRIKRNGSGKAYMFCEKDVYATEKEAINELKFNKWLAAQNKECAAGIERRTLREIFDAMDEEDK